MSRMTVYGVPVIALAILTTGCHLENKKTEARIQQMPINCDTAPGDLRMLDEEKKSTSERTRAGVSSVVPIGLVGGLVTGTAGTKYRIATGQYNQMIDDKIAQIKQACPGVVADESN
jgi:hypothetical protein